MRVTCAVQRKARKKRVLELAKGFRGRKNRCYGLAIDMVVRKLKYQYRDRRKKKSQMRSLWIMRLNGALESFNISYSQFIFKLKTSKYSDFNRKTLSELAIRDSNLFGNIVKEVINA